MKKAILLTSHGSRSSQTKKEVRSLIAQLSKKADADIFQDAYLDIEYPNINEGIDLCVQKGAGDILVLLNFLNSGGHVDCDVPMLVEQSQKKYPAIGIRISEPMGQHPGVQNLFLDLIEREPVFRKPIHDDFSKNLLKWYRKNRRDLPWRQYKDPYKIWLSEVMLQQTTVSAVIPYYEKWVAKYPTVHDLAKTSEQQILNDWQGLGYYNRARNLRKAAQTIVSQYGGVFPKDPEAVRKLPGFGDYTTAAVLSIAFGARLSLIDANVRRVIMRFRAIRGLADVSKDAQIKPFLDMVLPKSKDMGDFNQALMELGALVCRSKEPVCNICPLRGDCRAYRRSIQELIPETKKKTIKDIHAVIAVIEENGKYFIQKRDDKGLLAGLWEFPGGKIEAEETPQEALEREVAEELGVWVTKASHLFDVTHYYTQYRVKLSVWKTSIQTKPSIVKDKNAWATIAQIHDRYPMPSGSAKIIDRLSK